MTKFLNLSTDVNLGTNSPSDYTASSQKAVKTYVDNKAVIQYNPLPTASANNVGKIYQYVGATNENYTNGFFYICREQSTAGTYAWEIINVSSSTITIKRFD